MKPVKKLEGHKGWAERGALGAHTKYISVQIIVFLVCKQITPGKIFHSKLDSSHGYFIVISHPPNWLCLKHISGLDCGNWGLSTLNSHVITTGTVFPVTPKMHIILLPWFKHVVPLVIPCRPGIQFNGCIHTNLLPVMGRDEVGRVGGSDVRNRSPLLILMKILNSFRCSWVASLMPASRQKAKQQDLHWCRGNYCCSH